MYPAPFEYCRAASLDEALSMIAEFGHEARPLAGGQSLLPLLKLRLMRPTVLIDIGGIAGLSYETVDGERVRLGALRRHVEVEQSELFARQIPLAHEAVGMLGDVQVRNMGTVGGASAEADPAGDWGPALLALGGEITAASTRGSRTIPVGEFFVDFLTSALEPDELVTEVSLGIPTGSRTGGCYLKLERRAGDFAVVSAGVQLSTDESGKCEQVSIGLGGVGHVPLRPLAVESALRGSLLDDSTIDDACGLLRELVDPVDDAKGPSWYKRDMSAIVFGRALRTAMQRAANIGSPLVEYRRGRTG